MVVLIVEWS